jgi:hypothetical protein
MDDSGMLKEVCGTLRNAAEFRVDVVTNISIKAQVKWE